ncbi:MAG: hypothetical protein OXP71_05105 [Candidatus Poribacteria bacterium]|nr:hypothetical protein [Candidatus Poribacteria bacterium]
MKLARNHFVLLRCTVLFCGLCLLICCSADDEIQPAQIIEASSYHYFQKLNTKPLPLNGRGEISLSDTIELVFDKPVRQVSINTIDARPNQEPTATVWLLEIKPLEVWAREMGPHLKLEKDVTLTIHYEDETGVHIDTLDVTIVVYAEPASPPVISFADPLNNEINVDANRLNQVGIQIGFNKQMDTQRTRIVVYNRFPNPVAFERGQRILHWNIDWVYDAMTNETKATLLPKSEDDRLLRGNEYEVRLLAFYDMSGHGRGPEEGPLVIQFRTMS